MKQPLYETMYKRSLPYFSATLENVQRDWNKVTRYCNKLEIVGEDFVQNKTNEFLPQATKGDTEQQQQEQQQSEVVAK